MRGHTEKSRPNSDSWDVLEDEGLDRGDEDELVENEVHGEDDNQNIRVSHLNAL